VLTPADPVVGDRDHDPIRPGHGAARRSWRGPLPDRGVAGASPDRQHRG